MVGAFFVFSALIATVSNGTTGRESSNEIPTPRSLDRVSTTDPDFYFIEANQFVPGSARTQKVAMASMTPPINFAEDTPLDALPTLETLPTPESLEAIAQPELSNDAQHNGLASEPRSTDVQVRPGDTLSELLIDNGVPGDKLYSFVSNDLVKKHLSRLRVNQTLKFSHNADGSFSNLSARLGQEKKLVVSTTEEGFSSTVIDMPLRRESQAASAVVDSSLFLAGQAAGLSQKTIMNLVDIFKWDVDFSMDIRKGDSFKVVYEKLYRDGEFIGEGDILAAEFTNAGRAIRALRYTDFNGHTGYYTPEGRSMRKAFLRNPVDVVRITSHFNLSRMHPVLHTIRAHKGTDYGAPIGTPIRTTGDGKVIFAGVKGGYGNTIVIKHGDRYTTLYAHMSKFAKSIRAGKRVKQGQIIGYVGRTGRVTGPHLHYEFRINGEHKNPLKVKLPGARPLHDKFKADFASKSREIIAILDSLQPERLVASGRR